MFDMTDRPLSAADSEAAICLSRLYVKTQLGTRPRLVKDQEAAIAAASSRLDTDDSTEARMARRALAIEYLVYRDQRKPSAGDWEAAIVTVDASDDETIRRHARGGMYLAAYGYAWVKTV
jgi:hypothetical protein